MSRANKNKNTQIFKIFEEELIIFYFLKMKSEEVRFVNYFNMKPLTTRSGFGGLLP